MAQSLKSVFDELVSGSLRPLSLGIGIYYGLLAVAHLQFVPPSVRLTMSAIAGVSSCGFLILYSWLRRGGAPVSWSQPIEFGMGAVVLANCVAHLYFVPNLYGTTNFALAILGAGLLFLSGPALAIYFAAAFAGWLGTTWASVGTEEWTHFLFMLMAAAVLSTLTFTMRVRSIRALEGAQRLIREMELRRKAEEGQRELENQVRQAQKLESLGLMAGGVAHDFNNLLAGILGNAELALESIEPGSEVETYLRRISQTSQRASQLTRQMLAYSGKAHTPRRRLDLSDEVDSITDLLEASLPKRVSFSKSLRRDLPAVKGDAGQIEQVALNLVVNAGEAIGEAQGTVRLTTGIERLEQSFFSQPYVVGGESDPPEGDYVYIEVSDSGCGISAGDLQRIFDPFFSTKLPGRGLGLSVVQGILRGHGGALHVLSEPGRGATVRAFFPACEGEKEPPEPPRPRVDPQWRGRGLILVVDDEEPVRTVASQILARRGFEILSAKNGDEAVQLFRDRRPQIDLVLLDVTMPRLGGEETLRKLRGLDSSVTVVFTSGYSEHDIAERFAREGGCRVIEKPFHPDTLLSEVRAALKQ